MTRAVGIPKENYDGNDSATVFPFDYVFWDDTDLLVTLENTVGGLDILELGVDYTVTGGDGAVGSIIYPISGDPLATGEVLSILSNVPIARDVDMAGIYQFITENLIGDKIVTMVQQLAEQLGRCAKFEVTNLDTPPTLEALISTTGDGNHANFDNLSFAAAGHTGFTGYTSQSGAPSSTPSKVGLINIDETADIAYISTGTASSADWSALGNRIRYLDFSLVAPGTDCAEGTNLYGDHVMKFSGTFLQSDTNKQWLMANNTTAGVTGTMVLDIHLDGTTIMDTNKLDIETGEKTTETATTQPALTTTAFTAGQIVTIDTDAVHTTPAKGSSVSIAVLEGI